MNLRRSAFLFIVPAVLLASCATPKQPMQVNVASVERIPGGAMELRFNARLRVQNPNDATASFSGAAVELQLLNGKTIGTGVTDADARIPAFTDVMVDVPVTVNALGDVRQAIGLYGAPDRKLDVMLKGRLNGVPAAAARFEWRGELAMPLPPGS